VILVKRGCLGLITDALATRLEIKREWYVCMCLCIYMCVFVHVICMYYVLCNENLGNTHMYLQKSNGILKVTNHDHDMPFVSSIT
jgi:hypothetical protein